jgi:uncharacterized protein
MNKNKEKFLSPWVFVTYNCSCACPYCMVPKIQNDIMSMSSETFEKMLKTAELLLEKNEYNNISFRLSGGEPLLVWKNYANIITKYKEKYANKISFGLLSNLTILNNDILQWLKLNQIGIQVSLDDLENSKPLNNGESSSKIVLKNIEILKENRIPFSINTVFDYSKTKSLKLLTEYIIKQPISQWGLSASFTLNDDSYIEEIMYELKACILLLKRNNFDIFNKFRFYNEIVNSPGMTCSAGVNLIALGTNLEVWPCQSMIDKKPLGYFDENIKELLATSKENGYFYNRTLLPQCTDCSILNWCRGGCRAVHLTNKKAIEVTCLIKQEVFNFLLSQNIIQNNLGEQVQNNLFQMFKEYGKKDLRTIETPKIPIIKE